MFDAGVVPQVVDTKMATDVDQAYCGWSREELSDRDESQDVSVSQMLDHGSISFGRFAFESLEWEKRSVFTCNKRQEELEKFKSPGLVAQKKAYFEEYYKRIRALKAMQENHQTELTLDYVGDGSISSQTGEEDETAAQLENVGDGLLNGIDAHSKEASIEVSLDKKHNDEAIQIKHIVLEPASSNLDSSRKDLVEINQEKNNGYALQKKHLKSGSTMHEALSRTEGFEQRDISNFDDKGISRKYNNSESIVKQEKKSFSYDVQYHYLGRKSTENESSVRRIEEIEKHALGSLDIKEITGKHDSFELNAVPEVAAGGTFLYPTDQNAEDLELMPDYDVVLKITKPTVKKYKEDRMPVLKIKGTAASIRNGLKLESKAQSDINSSQGPKYPFQKTISKAKNSVGSSSMSTDRVLSYRPTPVILHKPLTEVRSNVTTPRPFTFATERRSAIPTGTGDGAPSLSSKTSNKLVSSLNLDASKRATRIYSVKGRGLENKRRCDEVRKIDLTLDSLKGRGEDVHGPPKVRISRSINLPAQNQSNQSSGSEHRPTNAIRKDKREEEKGDARPRDVRISTKIATPRTGNLKAKSKKVDASQTNSLSLTGRSPRIGGSSHKMKPRQEMPRWR